MSTTDNIIDFSKVLEERYGHKNQWLHDDMCIMIGGLISYLKETPLKDLTLPIAMSREDRTLTIHEEDSVLVLILGHKDWPPDEVQ